MFNYFKKTTSGKIAFYLMALIGLVLSVIFPSESWISFYGQVLIMNTAMILFGAMLGFISFSIDINIRLFAPETFTTPTVWYNFIIFVPFIEMITLTLIDQDRGILTPIGEFIFKFFPNKLGNQVFFKYMLGDFILILFFIFTAPFRRMIRIEKMLKRIQEKSSDSDISK